MDKDSFSHDQDIIDILKGAESKRAEYPPELFAARRKLFLEQLEKQPGFRAVEPRVVEDQKLVDIFKSLKALDPEYPRTMLARQRSLYKQRILEADPDTIWHALQRRIQHFVAGLPTFPRSIPIKFAHSATLAVGIAMVTFVAFALYGNSTPSSNPGPLPTGQVTATSPQVVATLPAAIVCADGDEPPLCIAVELDKNQNVAYPGNGKARPAVAKDASNGAIHTAANLNDGLYGPSAGWVSESPNSWIKIDLGKPTPINTVTFGRDRLGVLNDGDPGRFVIAVAASDDMYADGDSRNDEREYVQVFDSRQAGFDGTISGAETVIAMFDLKQARFIKITFENPRTAIDEVEAFVSKVPLAAAEITKRSPREEEPARPATALPAYTPIPSDTATAVPVDTLPPTDTVTPVPSDTPPPVDTPTPIDTPTPVDLTQPPASDTPAPIPTGTSSAGDAQSEPATADAQN